MKKNILVFAAYDRFNYGDLLFPYIVEYHLKDINTINSIKYYSVKQSDLSKFGGKKTQGLTDFYKECNNILHENIVIIAGGETVGVTWDSYYTSLYKRGATLRKLFAKIRLSALFNIYAKIILHGEGNFVFSIDKKNFKNISKIIFNANGASSVDDMPVKSLLTNILNKVDYLAVRDKKSYFNLKSLGINSYVFPDSAIMISELYTPNCLEKKVKSSIVDFINKKEYIIFQINSINARKYHSHIAGSLEKIKSNHNIEICLCPIGLAHGHNDIEGLKIINNALNFKVSFFKEVSIWDIMMLISRSKAYVGTSLHGIITAMSYSVPYIGIYPNKLDSYLQTWGVDGSKKCVDADKIHIKFNELLGKGRNMLELNRNFQISKSKESFAEITKIINS